MSIGLMNAAWRLDMPASRKLVLLAMCDWANDDGESCHPSIKSIALRASMSQRQAQRVLHELIEAGWIAVIGNAAGGAPGQTRQYRLNVNAIATGDATVTGDSLSRVTNGAETGDTGVVGRVTSSAKTGDTHVTQPTNNPPINRKSNRQVALDLSSWPEQPSQNVLTDWLAMRKRRRADVSQTVIAGMAKQLRIAAGMGWSVDDCLTECVLRNWQGLKAEWLQPRKSHANSTSSGKLSAVDQVAAAIRERREREQFDDEDAALAQIGYG